MGIIYLAARIKHVNNSVLYLKNLERFDSFFHIVILINILFREMEFVIWNTGFNIYK